jgi:hypothetical protein
VHYFIDAGFTLATEEAERIGEGHSSFEKIEG